ELSYANCCRIITMHADDGLHVIVANVRVQRVYISVSSINRCDPIAFVAPANWHHGSIDGLQTHDVMYAVTNENVYPHVGHNNEFDAKMLVASKARRVESQTPNHRVARAIADDHL